MLTGVWDTDVNEGDPTKPLLAIFTVKTVRSYEPLTISYAGQIDLEEDEEIEVLNMPVAAAVARGKSKGKKPKKEPKVIEDSKRTCFCGAPRCSGRMFRDADMVCLGSLMTLSQSQADAFGLNRVTRKRRKHLMQPCLRSSRR